MEAERESVGLAVPFTAGIAAANYSSKIFYDTQEGPYAAAAVSFACFAAIWVACCLVNRKSSASGDAGRGFIGMELWKGRLLVGSLFAAAGLCISFMAHIPGAVPAGNESPIVSAAESCAGRMKAAIDSLPFTDGRCNALLKAFLTGDRSGIDGQLREMFRDSGASHLLALSGMHMGIIYVILSKLLSLTGNSPCSKKLRSCLIITGSGFFTVMTGASASTVRAFLFIMISEIAGLAGRKTDGPTVLSTALMIQLAINPGIISSISFQLSYLAMTGIFTVYPRLHRMWPGPARKEGISLLSAPLRKIWDLCALSISCQLFTGPLALARFGTFPQYFLLANLMCIPLMSIIMFSSAAVLALQAAGICPEFLAEAAEIPIKLLIFVIETISSM